MGWAYKTYVTGNGRAEVQMGIDRLDATASERFQAQLRWLHELMPNAWHEPHAKKLKGYGDLYEIRFKANGVQQRPIGFFGPQVGEFTIVIWATHKQDIYRPPDALDAAEKRRKLLLAGTGTATSLQIDGEAFPFAEE